MFSLLKLIIYMYFIYILLRLVFHIADRWNPLKEYFLSIFGTKTYTYDFFEIFDLKYVLLGTRSKKMLILLRGIQMDMLKHLLKLYHIKRFFVIKRIIRED